MEKQSGTESNVEIVTLTQWRTAEPPYQGASVLWDGPPIDLVMIDLLDYSQLAKGQLVGGIVNVTVECAKDLRDQLNALFPAQA